MALETLKDLTHIGGEAVSRSTHIWAPIYISDVRNTIEFQIQNGPIKEVGKNGCQVDSLILTAKLMIEGLNKNFPSHYNERAISGLERALNALRERTEDREKRGVEGTSQG
jgi:hypothetical protein